MSSGGRLTLPGEQTTAPLQIYFRRTPRTPARNEMPRDRVVLSSLIPGSAREREDVIAASRQAVDMTLLAEQLQDDLPTTDAAVTEWAEKFLTMLLADDHSAVNRAGHGDRRESGYRELPRTPPTEGPLRATRETSILMPVSADDFVATDVAGPRGFALIMAFGNLPRDAVTFVWRKSGRGWSIVRMFALPD
jgi:hypothetical protein